MSLSDKDGLGPGPAEPVVFLMHQVIDALLSAQDNGGQIRASVQLRGKDDDDGDDAVGEYGEVMIEYRIHAEGEEGDGVGRLIDIWF